MNTTDEWTAQLQWEANLRAEVKRLRKMIQAEHRYKAAQGGAPCVCEVCVEESNER